MRNRKRRLRRGVTLVEVMATMTTLTVVLGLSVALVEMLLKLNASGLEHVETEAALARVARVFREDVREAAEASRCDVGGTSLALALKSSAGDRSIEYQATKAGIVRVEWAGPEVVRQERFRVPSLSAPRFERSDAGGRGVVALVLDRRSRRTKGESAAHPFRIESTLGAARRFEPRGEARR